MGHRLRLIGLLCVAAVVVLVATMTAGAAKKATCATQVNDTAAELLPCIKTADLKRHMQAFENIAIANPGPDGHPSRNSGEPGYWASAQYVANVMKQAGYDVTIQPYKFTYTSFVGTPTWSESSPTARNFTLVNDWNPGTSDGTADANVRPADGIVLAPTETSSSTS